MNVSLTDELDEFVRRKVESGLYLSASEVVREALRLLEERDRLRELQLNWLRKEVGLGVDQLERGEVEQFDVERIKEEGRKLLSNRSGKENGKDCSIKGGEKGFGEHLGIHRRR